MDDEPVVVEVREGGVLVMTLNRPRARNAVDAATAQALAAAVDRLEADDDLRAGVLTGAGGTFCAGMDLKAFLRGEAPTVAGRGFGGITARPARKPVVAAVEGWALAGGFELVLACDVVVAARTARFGVPEVKRGLVAAAGAAVLLPLRIPRAVALEMLYTGDPVEAEWAEALGLVNRVTRGGWCVGGRARAGRPGRGQRAARGPGDAAGRPRGRGLDPRRGAGAAGRADRPGLRQRRRPGGCGGARGEARAARWTSR